MNLKVKNLSPNDRPDREGSKQMDKEIEVNFGQKNKMCNTLFIFSIWDTDYWNLMEGVHVDRAIGLHDHVS